MVTLYRICGCGLEIVSSGTGTTGVVTYCLNCESRATAMDNSNNYRLVEEGKEEPKPTHSYKEVLNRYKNHPGDRR